MSQQIVRTNRSRRRRVIVIAVIAVLGLAILLYAFFKKDPPENVRIGQLQYGDIKSYMILSAEIYPGSVEQLMPEQRQRVMKVHVSRGDNVLAGDTLLTLDQSELEEQYQQARSTREEIEQSIEEAAATADEKAAAQRAEEAAAEEAAQTLSRQLTSLSSRLTDVLSRLVQLTSLQPSTLEIDPALAESLTQLLQDFDPEAEDADTIIQQAIALLTESVTLQENPDYQTLLTQLQSDIERINTLSGQVLSSLTGQLQNFNVTGGLDPDLLDQLGGQLGGLDNTLQSALRQAVQLEDQAKENLDNSSAALQAPVSGVIAQINVEPGEYTGSTAGSLSQPNIGSVDLSSLLTQGQTTLPAAGLSTTGTAAIVIYDTTRPKAIFKASQFDSDRLEEGMPVHYQSGDLVFSGEITYIAPFANAGSFSGSNDLGSDLGAFSDLGSEPWREVEMSILGTNRNELIPGFAIDAEIETASAENVLILPAEAMRRELDAYYVFVVDDDNTLVRKAMTPGIQSDMSVEVLDGLGEADRVVLNPDSSLQPGMTVTIEEQDGSE